MNDYNDLIARAWEYQDAMAGGEDANWTGAVNTIVELRHALEASQQRITELEAERDEADGRWTEIVEDTERSWRGAVKSLGILTARVTEAEQQEERANAFAAKCQERTLAMAATLDDVRDWVKNAYLRPLSTLRAILDSSPTA